MRSAGKILTPTILMIAAIWLGAAPAWAASAPAAGGSASASGPAPAAPADSALSASARKAVDAAASGLNLQTEIPDAPANGRRPRDDRYRDQREYSPGNYPAPPQPTAVRVPEIVVKMLLWLSVAVIVVVILMAARDNWRQAGRTRRMESEEAPEMRAAETTQAALRMDLSQDEADELARRGLFAEAMHVLLLRSVSEMRRRLDLSIAASLTSREILGRISLPPEGRSGFADIIGRVEVSYFGPYQPGADEYLACRRSFERLTGTLRGEAAR